MATTDQDSTRSQDIPARTSAESRAVAVISGVYDEPREAARLARRIVTEARALAREVEAGGSDREFGRMFSEHLGVGSRGLSDEDAHLPVAERFTNLVVSSLDRDLARNRARTPDEILRRAEELLRELSEARTLRRLTPEARAARQDIEFASPATDDLRSLLVTPEDRTRAEHADHLGRTNKIARELYERGADVYGDVLVLPVDPHEREQARDEIKISSLAYAANTFERFIGDKNEARSRAAEFVELANTIAGRTADSDMRLAVFRAYYDRIRRDQSEEVYRQRDGSEVSFLERGNFLPPEQQRERFGIVIEEMRETAAVLSTLEWKTSRHEFVEISEWERGLSSRQEHAQDEEHGYRTPYAVPADEDERERKAEREGGRTFIEHASVRLDEAPPVLTRELEASREEIAELLLAVDRRLARGARPDEIQGFLTNQETHQGRREQADRVRSLFERRGLVTELEAGVTREDELAALYTLRALAANTNRNGAASKATVEITNRIEELQPYTVERLTALVGVRDKATRSLTVEEERLAAFARAEQGLATLERIERAYRDHVRLTPEWQQERARLREQEAALNLTTNKEVSRERKRLIGELEVPLVTEFKHRLAGEVARHQAYYREITGHEELTSAQAHAHIMPRLESTRTLHDRAVGEIAALRERTGAPLPERSDAASERNELYLSPTSDGRLRLPLTSFTEYRTIARLAENLNRAENRRDRVSMPIAVSTDMWRAPVGGGDDADRTLAFQFVRDYANYRAQDAQTRLRASNALARDYLHRLERTATPDEMRGEVADIARENRNRREHPERYRAEEERAGGRGGVARRALRDDELRQVLLASSPAHHTGEMRLIRIEAATPAGVRGRLERARQMADLEQGRTRASPALRVLLTELERVRSPRDMKLFYAQMLNNPQELPKNLPRISRENLFAAHESLTRVERDYVFGKLEARRVELTRSAEERATAHAYARLDREDGTKNIRRDSGSYKAYTAEVAERSRELLTRWHHESLRNELVSSSRNQRLTTRDLDRVLALANAHGVGELSQALAPFGKSPNLRDRQMRELVAALTERETNLRDDRHTEVKLHARQGSELTPTQWQKALVYIAPRLRPYNAENQVHIPEPVREAIRAHAITEAWAALRPTELYDADKLPGMSARTARALVEHDRAVGAAIDAQTRARIADRAQREFQEEVISRAKQAVTSSHAREATPVRVWQAVAADRLNGVTLAQTVERMKARDSASKSWSEEDISRVYHALDQVTTEPMRARAKQLAAYAATTRVAFVESFVEIDRAREMSRTQVRAHGQGAREHAAVEHDSPSFRTFSLERDEHEKLLIRREVARLLRDERAGFESFIERADDGVPVRDLIPKGRREEINREAVEKGFWKLLPIEISEPSRGGKQLPENVERAALQVSDRVDSAMLVERGLRTSHEPENKANGERLMRESFHEIDRAQAALAEARVEMERESRREVFRGLRPALAESINGYLKGVLETHGEKAFEKGKGLAHHTAMTAQIIRDTFREHDITPDRINFTEERIMLLARSIVEPLPQQLAYARAQSERTTLGRHDHQLDERRQRDSSQRGFYNQEMNRQEQGQADGRANRRDIIERSVALQAERSEDLVPFRPTNAATPISDERDYNDHSIAATTKIKEREVILTR